MTVKEPNHICKENYREVKRDVDRTSVWRSLKRLI